MPVDRVLFEAHRVQFRQELVGQARARDQPQPRTRVVGDDELRQLLADPLRADDLEPVAHTLDRFDDTGVGFEAERRHETRGAQHAQGVVLERDVGRHRCAEPPSREVGDPAERVDEVGLVEREGHRVHREVAARQVGLDVVGELHLGLAALGPVHLGAERRDLEAFVVLDAPDGAVPLALQPHRVGPRRDDRFHGVRARRGRDVDVGERAVEKRVANAATDHVGAVPGRGEAPGKLLGGGAGSEVGRKARRDRHGHILATRAGNTGLVPDKTVPALHRGG